MAQSLDEGSNLIPWDQVVKLHQDSQKYLLKMIDMYSKLAKSQPNSPEIEDRIKLYKRMYLGIEHNNL